MFFIQVVRGRPGGRLQFSGGGSIEDGLASICVLIHSCKMPQKVRRRDLMMDETVRLLKTNKYTAYGIRLKDVSDFLCLERG